MRKSTTATQYDILMRACTSQRNISGNAQRLVLKTVTKVLTICKMHTKHKKLIRDTCSQADLIVDIITTQYDQLFNTLETYVSMHPYNFNKTLANVRQDLLDIISLWFRKQLTIENIRELSERMTLKSKEDSLYDAIILAMLSNITWIGYPFHGLEVPDYDVSEESFCFELIERYVLYSSNAAYPERVDPILRQLEIFWLTMLDIIANKHLQNYNCLRETVSKFESCPPDIVGS